MDKKLTAKYYSTDGYWKGYSAVSKLANATNIDTNIVKKWLWKQAIWQIYLPPPDYVPDPIGTSLNQTKFIKQICCFCLMI